MQLSPLCASCSSSCQQKVVFPAAGVAPMTYKPDVKNVDILKARFALDVSFHFRYIRIERLE